MAESDMKISNFAIPGYESVHNLLYWENETYAGIGAGAHGYINGNRYSNIGPIKHYMASVDKGERPVQNTHAVTETEAMEEEMFLGLRKADGVSISLFEQKFGKSIIDIYGQTLQTLQEKDLIELVKDRVKLTYTGVFRGNEVFQEFLK